MGCGAAEVIGDGDVEGIRAVEIGVWCVKPGAGFGIDGRGAIAGYVAAFDGEIGAIGEAFLVCGGEGVCDGGLFCAGAGGPRGDDRGIINGSDGQVDGLGGGAAKVVGDGDGEGIGAVEVGGWCVGPGTGFGIEEGGAVGGAVAISNGEDGAIGEAFSVCG